MTVDRMSPLDATFLHVEDSVSHMHIGAVLLLDPPAPPYEELAAMIGSKLHRAPRYRQSVRFVPLQLARPVWVDDRHFNLEYHLRHTALPVPGGEAELQRLVGRIMSQQLDRARPLWELWAVEGLDDGRWALISKVHHSMVDGVSGVELLTLLLDIVPDPPTVESEPWVPTPAPTQTQLAKDAVVTMARSPYEQFRAVRASTRVPRYALSQLHDVGRGLGAMAGLARPTRASSLNGPIGPHRRHAWGQTTVDDIKRVRKTLGGTFNDVVLTAITAGFRELLATRGESVDRVVRTLVPMSDRSTGCR
jgi:diacylglycerol O-acyltransferase / wax synthase